MGCSSGQLDGAGCERLAPGTLPIWPQRILAKVFKYIYNLPACVSGGIERVPREAEPPELRLMRPLSDCTLHPVKQRQRVNLGA